jgi:hypothetical protein
MFKMVRVAVAVLIKRWRFNNEPVTVLSADLLAVGMVLSPHNHEMGVRVCGEKISGIERGDEGGTPVVYVRSAVGYGVWPVRLSDLVSVVASSLPANLTSRTN